MNDLIVGAWRNGLDETTGGYVTDVEARKSKGFRQLPYESTVQELTELLDSYDELVSELLQADCECSQD